MAVYLVDFENVTSAGISGIQKLTKEDKVYIFYTVNASSMSFAAHLNLLSSPAEVVYYNVASGGKNALDFQLASFLGYLICQGKEKKFCIISNDRGFEYVKTFWEKNGVAADISISGSPSINRSLMMLEKPFTARIQPNAQEAANLTEAVCEKPAENIAEVIEEQRAAESAPKRRGRPKGGKSASKTEESPKSAVKSEAAAKTGTALKNVSVPRSVSAARSEASPKPKAADKPSAGSAEPEKKRTGKTEGIPASLITALEKAEVTDKNEISSVMELLTKTDGKQQFYRGILKIFGMERGVEVYKAVRPEYTNLTKIIKG